MTVLITFKVTAHDRARYHQAAETCGYDYLSEYLREKCEALCAQAVREHGKETVAQILAPEKGAA